MQENGSGNGRLSLSQYLRLLFAQILTPAVFPVALLIDGDNYAGMSSEVLAQILVEAGKLGGVVVRKVYGNWSSPTMDWWRDLSMHDALEPVHYAPMTAAGKNGADIALALDALDLYRCHGIRHFCLVASDSDYLPLVRRLRANGCVVIVIGKATTLPALKTSTLFIDLEHLVFSPSKRLKGDVPLGTTPPGAAPFTKAPVPVAPPKVSVISSPQKSDELLRAFLLKAYDQAAKGKKDEWVSIQRFHAALVKMDPSFTLSTYQYKNFTALFQAHVDVFETRKQSSGHLALRKRTER